MQKRNGIWYTSGNVPITDFQQIIELNNTYPNADNSGLEIADPHPADNQFVKWGDAVNAGLIAMNEAADVGEISELLAPEVIPVISPAVYGTLLMNMLRTTEEPFTLEDKKFLVDLAADLGPDWLNRLSGAVAFMIKVDSFQ